MYPRETPEAFDALLSDRGMRLDGVVIGGAALSLLGVISRETKDFDILSPPLDGDVLHASKDLAIQIRLRGGVLADDWLNKGPATLASDLPPGRQTRVQLVYRGAAIEFHTLGREDLLKAKVFALCDRGFDLADCIALRPTEDELAEQSPWLEVRDLHPGWPAHVRETVAILGRRLGHGV